MHPPPHPNRDKAASGTDLQNESVDSALAALHVTEKNAASTN